MSSYNWSPIASGGSGGVESLNLLVGALTIAAGTGISVSDNGVDTITISNTQAALTLAAIGSSPNANGATLTGQQLNLEPASASFGGVVTTGAQTFAGAKTFNGSILAAGGIDVAATGGTDTLTIGIANADIINIGRSGATINIQGDTFYQNVTNLQVTDKLFDVNYGGSAGSGTDSGFNVIEDSIATAYIKTSPDRNSWLFKAPNTAGIVTLTPGVSGFTIDQASHNPLTLGSFGSSPNANAASLSTQILTLQPADASNPGGVSVTTQSFAGAKTFVNDTSFSANINLVATASSAAGVINQDSARFIHTYGTSNLFIGKNAGTFSLTVGNAIRNIAIGENAGDALTTGFMNVMVGRNAGTAYTTANQNVAIGNDAQGSSGTGNTGTVVIGHNATTGNNSNSIVIGLSATATAANQVVFGSATAPASDIYFDGGVVSTTPGAFTINGTGGSGTNVAGANVQIAGGKGTGNAAPGQILFRTAIVGSSGTTLQSLATRGGFNSSGNFFLNGSTSGALTIAAAATTTSYTITMPSAQGAANSFLMNDGSGDLTWDSSTIANKVPYIWETNTIFYNTTNYANLQAAVDAAELLSGSDVTNANGVVIILPRGDFSGQSVLIKKNVNLRGQGPTGTTIGTVTYRPTNASSSPQTVSLSSLQVNNLAAYNETVGGGVFDDEMLLTNGLVLENVNVHSSITFNRLCKVYFRSCFIDGGTIDMDLCEIVEFDNCTQTGAAIDWTVNDAASNLPSNYTGGNLKFSASNIAAVTLTKAGGSTEAYFQAADSFIDAVTRNGDTLINMKAGGVGSFSDSGSNNTFSDWFTHGPYTPAVPANWATQPTFIDDALDQLAAGQSVRTLTVGESIAANTSFVVRFAINGETAGRVYKTDQDSTSSDKYEAFGIVLSTSALSAGDTGRVTIQGTHTLGGSDTPFNAADIGKPVYLTASGAFSITAPTTSAYAVVRIGFVQTTSSIWVQPQFMGIN